MGTWWDRMTKRADACERWGDGGVMEAAVMPRSGRVIVMSSHGNEVISPAKAKAIFDAMLLAQQRDAHQGVQQGDAPDAGAGEG